MTTMPQHSVPDRHSTAARQLLLTASAVFRGRRRSGRYAELSAAEANRLGDTLTGIACRALSAGSAAAVRGGRPAPAPARPARVTAWLSVQASSASSSPRRIGGGAVIRVGC